MYMSKKKLAFATSQIASSSTVIYKSALVITHGLLGQGDQHVSKAPTGPGRYLVLANQRWVSEGGSGGPAHTGKPDPTVWCRVDLGPCNCRSADHLRRHPSLTFSFLIFTLRSRHIFSRGERVSPRRRAASNTTESLEDWWESGWGLVAFLAPCPIESVTKHATSATGLPKDSIYVPILSPRSRCAVAPRDTSSQPD